MIVGFNRGSAAILVMPWNNPNADSVEELTEDERIWTLIYLLRPHLHMEHFDAAAVDELRDTIKEVLDKHRPGGLVDEARHSKIRELWDPRG